MGDSGIPWARYTTSEMARDVLDLVDHLGWTEERQLHIVGVSMGGKEAPVAFLWAKRTDIRLSLPYRNDCARACLPGTAADSSAVPAEHGRALDHNASECIAAFSIEGVIAVDVSRSPKCKLLSRTMCTSSGASP